MTWLHKYKLDYLLLFMVCFLHFGWQLYNLYYIDPDAFYHIKMALLIKEQGVILDLPWQQFTILKDNFTDHQLLYHVLLIPFVSFGNPLIGGKIATLFISSGFIVLFYFFLKKNKIIWPWFWAYALSICSVFTFRLQLTKTTAISSIILYTGLLLIQRKKYWWLFALAFAYVWTYGGFTLLAVLTFFYVVAYLCLEKKLLYQPLIAVSAGYLCGLVINPYFPKNLFFYWQQFIQVGVINYQDKIGVGGEWYPYGFWNLLAATPLLTGGLLISLFIFFFWIKKQNKLGLTSALSWLFFFILTLKSRRYVEYYGPAALLFCATQITLYVTEFKKIKFLISKKILRALIICLMLILLPLATAHDIQKNRQDFNGGFKFTKMAAACAWLEANTPEHSIVVHTDWDEWPLFFYFNTHNYYLVGLEPTFMYNYDQKLYWDWVHLTRGQESQRLTEIVRDEFHSQYVLLENSQWLLDYNLKNNPDFTLVYADAEAKIYQLLKP